jgi:hypothetical protein
MSPSQSATSDFSPGEPSHAQLLAAALDLQRVGEGADRWVVYVLGIHTDGRHLWAQIAPDPDGAHGIVLRLSKSATARHALAKLATLSRQSFGYPAIVPVMCSV